MLRKLILFTVLSSFMVLDVGAQCAMCKAQLESNEGEFGNGINTGIIFLMIVPYVLIISIVAVFFRGRIVSSFKRFLNS